MEGVIVEQDSLCVVGDGKVDCLGRQPLCDWMEALALM